MKWPGLAAVEVALVTIHKGEWKGRCTLNNKQVKTITPYLDDSEVMVNPYLLKANENRSFQGSIVLGRGFVLTPEEAEELIAKDPRNKYVLFPYLNGEDLNNRPDQSPSRWVINFFDWTEEKCRREYPDCFEIVERLVKPEREKVNRAVRKKYWWRFAERADKLYRTIEPISQTISLGLTSKMGAFSMVKTNMVYSHALGIVADDQYDTFAILQSSLQNEWAWKYCSTMGNSTLRYTNSVAFETFPFPKLIATTIQVSLDQPGEAYHEQRLQLMLFLQIGLTKTYNLFHKKDLSIVDVEKESKQPTAVCEKGFHDIIKLRELHVDMDNAVLSAYGWTDLNLAHDFYEVDYLPENDRIRFTISPDARREVLKRLLKLNHEIRAQEEKAGLWEKKKTKKSKAVGDTATGTTLFNTVEIENDQS